MFAATGQREIGVRVGLTLGIHRVLVQVDLIFIAAPAGDDVDVCFAALRGEGIHPLIERVRCVFAQTKYLIFHEVALSLFVEDAHRLRQFRVVSVIPVDQHQGPPGQILLSHLLPAPARRKFRHRRILGGICPRMRSFISVSPSKMVQEKRCQQYKTECDPGQDNPSAFALFFPPHLYFRPAQPLCVSACYNIRIGILPITISMILFCFKVYRMSV